MAELARLPELTGEELDVLRVALETLIALAPRGVPATAEVVAVCQSLLTAVREARLSLDRPDGGG